MEIYLKSLVNSPNSSCCTSEHDEIGLEVYLRATENWETTTWRDHYPMEWASWKSSLCCSSSRSLSTEAEKKYSCLPAQAIASQPVDRSSTGLDWSINQSEPIVCTKADGHRKYYSHTCEGTWHETSSRARFPKPLVDSLVFRTCK